MFGKSSIKVNFVVANHIGDAGLQELVNAMKKNTTLRELSLSGQTIIEKTLLFLTTKKH